MHPDRGIVRTYISLDGLSTILDDQNTLTHQSADTNNAPRDPLNGPVIEVKEGGNTRHHKTNKIFLNFDIIIKIVVNLFYMNVFFLTVYIYVCDGVRCG